jgi:hypothetical protein
VIIEPVDPRDTRWEVDDPVYRVKLWRRLTPPRGVAQEDMAYECETFRVREAPDVHAVLEWLATQVRGGRTASLHVEHETADGERGLLRLAGTDPTAALTT